MNLKLTAFLLTILFVAGCGTTKKGDSESAKEAIDEAGSSLGEKNYVVYKAPPSYEYPNASLKLVDPQPALADTGDVKFQFEVSNYELGVQTPDAGERGIANSGKGQHIHFIVNNGPYSAHYEPGFTKNMKEGHYVILSFLSRSYHEAVKNDNSYILQKMTVGTPDGQNDFDPTGQHLFFSRPKGTYSGTDTEKLMIDFFLINTTISPDGNKIQATVNGEKHMITEWAPHYVEGLEKGEATVMLELLDKDGKLIPGPYNSVERKVTLE